MRVTGILVGVVEIRTWHLTEVQAPQILVRRNWTSWHTKTYLLVIWPQHVNVAMSDNILNFIKNVSSWCTLQPHQLAERNLDTKINLLCDANRSATCSGLTCDSENTRPRMGQRVAGFKACKRLRLAIRVWQEENARTRLGNIQGLPLQSIPALLTKLLNGSCTSSASVLG